MSVFIEPPPDCEQKPKKKKKYATKYNSKYREDFPWALPSSKGETFAFCQYCSVDICIRSVGAKGLRDHGSTSRHTQKSLDFVPTEYPQAKVGLQGTASNRIPVSEYYVANPVTARVPPQNSRVTQSLYHTVTHAPSSLYSVYETAEHSQNIYPKSSSATKKSNEPTFVTLRNLEIDPHVPPRSLPNQHHSTINETQTQVSLQTEPTKSQPSYSNEDLTCDICGKVFANWIDLKKDLLSHIPNKGTSQGNEQNTKKKQKSINKPKTNNSSNRRRGRPRNKKKTIEESEQIVTKPLHSEEVSFAAEEYNADDPPSVDDNFQSVQEDSDSELPAPQEPIIVPDISSKKSSYSCRVCKAVFYARKQLRSHFLESHNNGRPYECNHCGKFFTTKTHLEVHQKHKHVDGENPCKCKTCGKILSTRTNLRIHEIIHKGLKMFHCDICQKSFNRKANLETHMVYHSGERKFTCEVCGQSFFTMNTLKRHTKLHTGERNYACDVCGATYVTGTDLKRHQLKHDDVKPFPCNLCEKQFTRSHDLKVHLRYHNKEHQFTCEVCNKQFVESGNYRRHMRRHTGERPYSCKICLQTFSQAHHHKVHMRVHHPSGNKTNEQTEPKQFPKLQEPDINLQPMLHQIPVHNLQPMQPMTTQYHNNQPCTQHPGAPSSSSIIYPCNSYICPSLSQYHSIYDGQSAAHTHQ